MNIRIKIHNSLESPYQSITLELIHGELNELCYLDLYWLCQDNCFLKSESTISKGLLNFVLLLNNWKKLIYELSGKRVFLPFDFSDQYVSGLIVEKNQMGELFISYECTQDVIGPGVSPTQLDIINTKSKKFVTIFEKQQMELEYLIRCIDRGIYEALSCCVDN